MKRVKIIGAVLAMACSLVVGTQNSAQSMPLSFPWHLDRINQTVLPLDGNIDRGPLTGLGINIYIVDTGVRATHEQFNSRVVAGIDIPSENGTSPVFPLSSDCDGHGTHVAGLAAGSTVGVASQARVIAVRVLDCSGDGDIPDVVKALQWVRAHHRSGTAAIVNLSLGVDLGDDGLAIENQVLALINEGVVVTVASGNGNASSRPFDACKIAPGSVTRALTVGAVTASDFVAYYSNYGSCVDLFAPGGDRSRALESAWATADTDYDLDVGTSMASPLVAGYAALLAQQQPGLCVDAIANAINARATVGAVRNIDAFSPNRLLFINTGPVDVTAPGQASHVITSSDSDSIVVSWDKPCNGGSELTGTIVSLLSNGKVIRRANALPEVGAVRFSKLIRGKKYQVVVKARNAIGDGVATARNTTVAVRTLRVGQTLSTSSIANIAGDLSLIWSVSSSSSKFCRLNSTKTRLTALRSGTCRIGLRAIAGQAAVLRSLRISS